MSPDEKHRRAWAAAVQPSRPSGKKKKKVLDAEE
jgi:hypothetical protein